MDLAKQAKRELGMSSAQALKMLMGSLNNNPKVYNPSGRTTSMNVQNVYRKYGEATGMTADELSAAQKQQAIIDHILRDQ
jgi:hypothetical protein